MSFDTWIHLLEFLLVAGIFFTTFYVVKISRGRDNDH